MRDKQLPADRILVLGADPLMRTAVAHRLAYDEEHTAKEV